MAEYDVVPGADRGDLTLIADLLVPSLSPPGAGSADEAVLWSRSASEAGVDELLAQALEGLADHVRVAVEECRRALPGDFADLDATQRAMAWNRVAAEPATSFGALVVQSIVCAGFYTITDADGANPVWPALQFAGPLLAPPRDDAYPKTLRRLESHGPVLTHDCDVIVVGSGAGGGVAAARLAAAGLSVVVVEKGAYRNEPDLPQDDSSAFPNLYLGGGYVWSEQGDVACLAGSTVGGGTTVNSMACLEPPAFVRAEWAAEGMCDVATPAFDLHIAAVMDRINASVANTRPNTVNRILARGLDALGLAYQAIPRNARDADDRYCGSCHTGCLTGCKQSTMKTFLQDASDDGALLLDRCTVEEILVEDGCAAGVRGSAATAEGAEFTVTLRAPRVVLAAGALMTPLLLQQSGLGGPVVGEGLHVHPSYFMSGVFDEMVHGWQGQPLTTVCREFERYSDDWGFLIEAAPMNLGAWTGFTPWRSGSAHKIDQLRLRHVSGVWGFVRDHGAGSVCAGADGRPLIRWSLDDPIDLEVVRRCHVELARILSAAGARAIFTFLPGDPRWREGEDFDAFLATFERLEAADIRTLSAHQSGTSRAGISPQTSVVDGRGAVHGVRGVWVVDASALPTAPGVNPMISIEANASRTSDYIIKELSSRNR